MSEEINFEMKEPIERRLHTRHRAKTDVYIRLTGGGHTKCRAINLSASGVGLVSINDKPLGLRLGTVVNITFAIHMGGLTKLHRRNCTVKYTRNGVVGLHMDVLSARS